MPENVSRTPTGPDFVVSELLSELKASNVRKDELIDQLRKTIVGVVLGAFVAVAFVVAGFLLYLNQYDFSSTSTYAATGVYALIDSEGNVVVSDLTEEELQRVMEVLNADGYSTQNSDQNKD